MRPIESHLTVWTPQDTQVAWNTRGLLTLLSGRDLTSAPGRGHTGQETCE